MMYSVLDRIQDLLEEGEMEQVILLMHRYLIVRMSLEFGVEKQFDIFLK
jgi:hypothetical protein